MDSNSSEALIRTSAFLRALEFGEICDKRVKVSIIGPDRVGKTSLGKSLTGVPFNEKEPRTDGVQMSLPIKNAGTKAWKNLLSHQNTTAFDHKCAEIVKKERNRSAEPQRSDTVTPSRAANQRQAEELVVNEDGESHFYVNIRRLYKLAASSLAHDNQQARVFYCIVVYLPYELGGFV